MRWWSRWRWTMRRGRRRGSPAWWSTMRQGASKALLPGKSSNICTVHCDWPHVHCPGARVKLMLMMQSRARSRNSAGILATSMWSGLILQASSSTPTRWFQFRTGKKQTDIQYFPEKNMFFIPIHVKWFKQCTNKQSYQSIPASLFKALRLWILPEPPEPSRTLHSLKESWEINVLDGIIMAWHYQLSEFFYTELLISFFGFLLVFHKVHQNISNTPGYQGSWSKKNGIRNHDLSIDD